MGTQRMKQHREEEIQNGSIEAQLGCLVPEGDKRVKELRNRGQKKTQ